MRLLASLCLDKWINNPALTDFVKDLVQTLTSCLEMEEEKDAIMGDACAVGDEDLNKEGWEGNWKRFRSSAGSLIPSDMSVLESIVKLRSRLKVSQVEVYKAMLVSIVRKGRAVARLVIRLLILDDVGTGAIRPETSKYLGILFTSMMKSMPRGGSSSSSGIEGSVSMERGSPYIILGEAVGDICSMNGDKWTAALSKVTS